MKIILLTLISEHVILKYFKLIVPVAFSDGKLW